MTLGHLAQTKCINRLMLWYKHHGSLNQCIILTFFSIVVCRTAVFKKTKGADRQRDIVRARCIYQQAQAVEDNVYSYIMVAQELKAAEADVQLKKPGPNNPEEAEELIKQVKIAVDKFADVIHSCEPYKIEDAYTDTLLPNIMTS